MENSQNQDMLELWTAVKALSNNHDFSEEDVQTAKISRPVCWDTLEWRGGDERSDRTEVLALDEEAGAGSVHVPWKWSGESF